MKTFDFRSLRLTLYKDDWYSHKGLKRISGFDVIPAIFEKIHTCDDLTLILFFKEHKVKINRTWLIQKEKIKFIFPGLPEQFPFGTYLCKLLVFKDHIGIAFDELKNILVVLSDKGMITLPKVFILKKTCDLVSLKSNEKPDEIL